MDYEEMKLEHLKLIEGIIERMASNSLRLKEWFITITSALVGICLTKSKPQLLLVAGVALLAFWVLDAYYLQQERNFRSLYEAIVGDEEQKIPTFSLNVGILQIKQSYFKVLFLSWATIGFYGVSLVVGIIIWYSSNLIL